MKNYKTHTDPYSKTILRANQKPENPSLANNDYADVPSPAKSPNVSRTTFTFKTDHYSNCECAPDLYNRVLGPTADEAFLRGLQTLFNMCNKFSGCAKEAEAHMQPESTKPVPKVVSEILTSLGVPPEMASQIVQTSFAELEEKQPSLASKILQTSTPEMISRILSTVGLAPDMISEIMQVSLESLRPSVKSGVMQTTPPPSVKSGSMQTSGFEVPEDETPDLTIKSPTPSPTPSVKDSPDKEDFPKMCVCCKCGQPENNLTSKMCVCCKCKKSEVRPEKIETPQMCICCKCKRTEVRQECCTRAEPSKMYVCCNCREGEVQANGELIETPKSSVCIKSEIRQKSEDNYEKIETGKMCICCKCFTPNYNGINNGKPASKELSGCLINSRQCVCSNCCSLRNQERPKKKSRSSSIIDSIKSKFEPSPKARICRCYDCSAPVIYRSPKHCSCPKSKPKCKCSASNGQKANSETYILYGTGDTCPATETIYICEQGTHSYN